MKIKKKRIKKTLLFQRLKSKRFYKNNQEKIKFVKKLKFCIKHGMLESKVLNKKQNIKNTFKHVSNNKKIYFPNKR